MKDSTNLFYDKTIVSCVFCCYLEIVSHESGMGKLYKANMYYIKVKQKCGKLLRRHF